jgi:Glycosyltransferase
MEIFKSFFKDNDSNKKVIYNYVNDKSIIEKSEKFKVKDMDKHPSFLQVSRLVPQKAIERLLDVHKKLIDDGYEHYVYIVGTGPLKEELQDKIRELKVQKTFILLGAKSNPYPYIKECDYFMLTSYYEGYPMVLLEGKVLNKYILITDTASKEVLNNYDKKAIVSNDEEGIYEGIKSIVINKPKFKKDIKFSNKETLKEIEDLLEGEL